MNGSSHKSLSSGLDTLYSATDANDFTLAIVGDLHLERKGAVMFERARQQLLDVLQEGSAVPRVVQLGDLGGYNEKPGEPTPFQSLVSLMWLPADWRIHIVNLTESYCVHSLQGVCTAHSDELVHSSLIILP